MSAIITDVLKKKILQDIYDDVLDSSQHYYIGIGRSEEWDSADTVSGAFNTSREVRNARLSLQSVKAVEGISFVIPRNNWSLGTIYSGFDDNVSGYPDYKYYVLTEDNRVYICLQAGKDATGASVVSTVKPSSTSTSAFTTSDGYTWKFLYTVSGSDASKFLTSNYMPVQFVSSTDSSSPPLYVQQKGIQDAAIPGQISSIQITDGGTGYTSAPTVTIIGDGDSAEATATVVSGSVVKIEMNNDSAAMGSNYHYADIVLTGGGASASASARAVINPSITGIGGDPRDDLKSTALMFNAKPAGDEGGDFIISQDFRQIVLLKNPTIPVTDSDFTATTGRVLRSLTLDTVNVPFSPDKTIVGSSSTARAIIDEYDVSSSKIYYHQTEATGFTQFIEGETITEADGTGDGVLDSAGVDSDSLAFGYGELDFLSGQILYIDNRAAVDRDAAQTEDLKLIIQL